MQEELKEYTESDFLKEMTRLITTWNDTMQVYYQIAKTNNSLKNEIKTIHSKLDHIITLHVKEEKI